MYIEISKVNDISRHLTTLNMSYNYSLEFDNYF